MTVIQCLQHNYSMMVASCEWWLLLLVTPEHPLRVKELATDAKGCCGIQTSPKSIQSFPSHKDLHVPSLVLSRGCAHIQQRHTHISLEHLISKKHVKTSSPCTFLFLCQISLKLADVCRIFFEGGTKTPLYMTILPLSADSSQLSTLT